MKVPYVTTESGGLRAHVDGYVLGEHGGSINYLSIFGAIGAVQAVGASLVSGKSLHLYGNEEFGKELSKHFGRVKYRMLSKRLPSKMLSMIVIVEDAILSDEEDFVIITKTAEDPKNLLFRNLAHRSELPLHESWRRWIWATFEHFEWIIELPGYRMKGYQIEYNDDDLADAIRQGIRSRTIPEVK